MGMMLGRSSLIMAMLAGQQMQAEIQRARTEPPKPVRVPSPEVYAPSQGWVSSAPADKRARRAARWKKAGLIPVSMTQAEE